MAKEDGGSGFKYPYLPFATFTSLLTKMENEGVPDRVDRTYLKYTSGVMQSYLIATLKAFGLIDDDNYKTEALDILVKESEKRPELIGDLLKRHYTKQLALGPNATEGMLTETFDSLSGETKRKAITFFLHAAKYAGISLSPHFKAPRPSRSGGSGPRKKRERPQDEVDQGSGGAPTPPPIDGDSYSVTLADGTTLTLVVSKRLLSLLRVQRDAVLEVVDKMQELDAQPDGEGEDQ